MSKILLRETHYRDKARSENNERAEILFSLAILFRSRSFYRIQDPVSRAFREIKFSLEGKRGIN